MGTPGLTPQCMHREGWVLCRHASRRTSARTLLARRRLCAGAGCLRIVLEGYSGWFVAGIGFGQW